MWVCACKFLLTAPASRPATPQGDFCLAKHQPRQPVSPPSCCYDFRLPLGGGLGGNKAGVLACMWQNQRLEAAAAATVAS